MEGTHEACSCLYIVLTLNLTLIVAAHHDLILLAVHIDADWKSVFLTDAERPAVQRFDFRIRVAGCK